MFTPHTVSAIDEEGKKQKWREGERKSLLQGDRVQQKAINSAFPPLVFTFASLPEACVNAGLRAPASYSNDARAIGGFQKRSNKSKVGEDAQQPFRANVVPKAENAAVTLVLRDNGARAARK